MEFRINGEISDVKLTDERTAMDIVQSFSKHLKNGLQIYTLSINDRFYSPDNHELNQISVEDISTINIEVATKEEIAISLLQEAKNVILTIADDLKKNGFAHSKEFSELFDWINDTLNAINQVIAFNLSEIKLVTSTIHQIETYLESEERNESKIDSIINILENLIQYFDSIQLKIDSGYKIEKNELEQAITNGLEILPEISEAFQIGNDKEALTKIHTIINLLESCSIYLKQNLNLLIEQKGDEIDQMYNDLNGLLADIVDAFQNGDFVLIGDLLEYELSEKLESYKNIILGEK